MIDAELHGGALDGVTYAIASPYVPQHLDLAPVAGHWVVVGTDRIPMPVLPLAGTVTYRLSEDGTRMENGAAQGTATYEATV